MRAAILLAVGMLLMAGCGGSSKDGASGATITAGAKLSKATDRAHEAFADAKLTQVIGLEASDVKTLQQEIDAGDDQGETSFQLALSSAPDKTLADGRTVAWGYIFQSSNTVYGVVVDGEGKIPFAGGLGSEGDNDALPSGWVDSDRIATKVKGDSAFSGATSGNNAFIGYSLQVVGNKALWAVFAAGVDEPLLYDALSGEKVDAMALVPPPPLESESGSQRGTYVPAVAAVVAGGFHVNNTGHNTLAFRFSYQAAGALQGKLTVTPPVGEAQVIDVNGVGLQGGFVAAGFEAPVEGDYKWDLTVSLGTISQYGFSWCTDGLLPDAGVRACEQFSPEQ